MGTKSSRQVPQEDDDPPVEPLPAPMRERLTRVMVRGCHALELGRFHLNHEHDKDFTRPMCTTCPVVLFVLFRFGAAGYVLIFLIYYLIRELAGVMGGKVFIYLETWTYIGITLYLTLSFVNVAIDLYREYKEIVTAQQPGHTPLRFKLQWLFFNVSIVTAFVGTITFWIWILITHVLPTARIYDVVNLHIMLAIVAVIEVGLVTVPLRFVHIVYPLIFGITYVIFTVIYWAAGGTDPYGNHFIYAFLDYGKYPVRALYVILGNFSGSFVIHGLFTLVFQYKSRLFARCCPIVFRKEEELEMLPVSENGTSYERLD